MRTFDNSTGDLFAAPGCSLEDRLASLPAEPGSNEARRMTAGSGRRLCASFPKSGPLGSFSRILLGSETYSSLEFYLTWTPCAITARRSQEDTLTWVKRVDEKGRDYWIKSWATSSRSDTPSSRMVFQLAPSIPRNSECDIGSWATPRENDNKKAGGNCDTERAFNGLPAQIQLATWATPQSRDTKGQTQNPDRQDALPNQVKATWPTPDASNAGKTSRGGDRIGEPLIGGLVRSTWPMPQAHDVTGPRGKGNTLRDNHYYPHDLATATLGAPTSGPLAQMEKFVDRLMALSGWLMGYTDQYLAHWETASCRRSRRKLSEP